MIVPVISAAFPGLVMAQSTRHGGQSSQPYESLNLGVNTGDDPQLVSRNRDLFWKKIGTSEKFVAGGFQVHGSDIKIVSEPGYFQGYDAFITDKTSVFLTVSIADCVPVLIFDTVRKVVAAVHAGWRGTVQQIVAKTVARMTEQFGSKPDNCVAYIGTCIGFEAFEVGESVGLQFEDAFRTSCGKGGKFFVDLKGVNKKQLIHAGVPEKSIEVSPFCTVFNNDQFFSYRKENGETGRMLAVIGMLPGE